MCNLPKLIPTVEAFEKLDQSTKDAFKRQILALFGTFEEFWIEHKTLGFRLLPNADGTISIMRSRTCVCCGVETFGGPIKQKSEYLIEKSKSKTIICDTCGDTLGRQFNKVLECQ